MAKVGRAAVRLPGRSRRRTLEGASLHVQVEPASLVLTRAQCLALHDLFEYVRAHEVLERRARYASSRPSSSVSADPAAWWRYASTVCREEWGECRMSLSGSLLTLRRDYMDAFRELLVAEAAGVPPSGAAHARLAEHEKRLPSVAQALAFRCVALASAQAPLLEQRRKRLRLREKKSEQLERRQQAHERREAVRHERARAREVRRELRRQRMQFKELGRPAARSAPTSAEASRGGASGGAPRPPNGASEADASALGASSITSPTSIGASAAETDERSRAAVRLQASARAEAVRRACELLREAFALPLETPLGRTARELIRIHRDSLSESHVDPREDRFGASQLFGRGLQANRDGETELASELMAESARLWPRLNVLLSVANMYLKLGHPAAALALHEHALVARDATAHQLLVAREKRKLARLGCLRHAFGARAGGGGGERSLVEIARDHLRDEAWGGVPPAPPAAHLRPAAGGSQPPQKKMRAAMRVARASWTWRRRRARRARTRAR